MFLLVLAHPGSPGQRAVKRLLLSCLCLELTCIFIISDSCFWSVIASAMPAPLYPLQDFKAQYKYCIIIIIVIFLVVVLMVWRQCNSMETL